MTMINIDNVKLVNLTPHDVCIFEDGVLAETIQSTGLARCAQTNTKVGRVNGKFSLTISEYGEVSGLPAPQDGVMYIVAKMVTDNVELHDRTDLLIPGPGIRDDKGRVAGYSLLFSSARR